MKISVAMLDSRNHYAISRKKANNYDELENVFVKFNSSFCKWVIKELEKDKKVPDGFYSFNGASLELFEYLKQKNVITILEQTSIPHKLNYEILNKEIDKWKGWGKNKYSEILSLNFVKGK